MNRIQLLLGAGVLILSALAACEAPGNSDFINKDAVTATERAHLVETRTAEAIINFAQSHPSATPTPPINGATQTKIANSNLTATARYLTLNAPTRSATPKPSTTPIPTATETPPEVSNEFTDEDIAGLLLLEADAGGLTLQSTTDYSPEGPLGLKERFGSAPEAQPFIDAGLLRARMVAYDTGGKSCTNVCYLISTVMIFSDASGASQASDLWPAYQLGRDETLVALTGAQLETLFTTAGISLTAGIAGSSGHIGVGKFESETSSLWTPYSNALLVLEAGGKAGAALNIDDELAALEAVLEQAAANR